MYEPLEKYGYVPRADYDALRAKFDRLVEYVEASPHGYRCPSQICGEHFHASGRPCRRSPGCHGPHLAHEFEPEGPCDCWKAAALAEAQK